MGNIARRGGRVPSALWSIVLVSGLATTPAVAQKIKVHNTYGSPLDTIENTHLTTTVPEAQDFVRGTRPNVSKLDYTPLTGTDPDRPKPRNPKDVAALQAELESAGARNEARAKGLMPRKTIAAKKARAVQAEGSPPAR